MDGSEVTTNENEQSMEVFRCSCESTLLTIDSSSQKYIYIYIYVSATLQVLIRKKREFSTSPEEKRS